MTVYTFHIAENTGNRPRKEKRTKDAFILFSVKHLSHFCLQSFIPCFLFSQLISPTSPTLCRLTVTKRTRKGIFMLVDTSFYTKNLSHLSFQKNTIVCWHNTSTSGVLFH